MTANESRNSTVGRLGVFLMALCATLGCNIGCASVGFGAADDRFEPGAISITADGSTTDYPYLLLRPAGLAEGETVPLVVFLHGVGERGSNNAAQLRHFPERFVQEPHLTRHKAFLLAVQCPLGETWTTIERRWEGPTDFSRPTSAIKAVDAAIRQVLAEEPIDTDRVYLTGLSMGGYGAWDLAARTPDRFAAVVPICGGGALETVDRFVDIPIWAFHGEADTVVPEQRSREMIDAIRAAGGKPRYTPLPGVGHESWHFAYGPEGAMDWMFAQSRGAGQRKPDRSAGESPNVVLIMTDDQGYGDLSCHGNPVLQTPNLDALANDSARLGTFYVQPVCAPTRAALMTGRVPQRTTAIDTWIARAMLESEEVTLAERLGALGYATGIFGKWHLGDCHPMRPIDQGFDTAVVHLGGGIGQPSDPEGGERKYTDPVLVRDGVPESFEGYCTDIYFDEAMDWIGRQDAPFLCVLTTNAPHGPYHDVPPGLLAKYTDLDLDPVGADNADGMARVFAMIENIDMNVGRLMAKLEALGLEENTLVIYMHDNGPQWNRYNRGLRGIKGSVYEGGIRSPFFARWPGRIPPGDRPAAVGQHVDVVPTILEATGAFHVAEGLDGRSLMGVLQDREDGRFDRAIVVQSHRGDAPVKWHNAMIRRGDWKLVNATGFGKELEEAPRRFELFNLRDDPGEQHDLAETHPEVVAQLAREYEAWFDDVGANDPGNYEPPAISIGAIEEPVSLTRQDWRRTGRKGGWGGRSDGAWRLDVQHEGPYRIRVRFLPNQPPPDSVRLQFNGDELAVIDVDGSTDAVFESVRLPVGTGWFKATMLDARGSCGAYQVIVESGQHP